MIYIKKHHYKMASNMKHMQQDKLINLLRNSSRDHI